MIPARTARMPIILSTEIDSWSSTIPNNDVIKADALLIGVTIETFPTLYAYVLKSNIIEIKIPSKRFCQWLEILRHEL